MTEPRPGYLLSPGATILALSGVRRAAGRAQPGGWTADNTDCSRLGTATSATQFFRNTGGTIGVSVMGALMTAGLPLNAASASPDQLAHAIHPVFVLGVPLMALALVLVLLIPEKPLRRSVREGEPAPTPA